MTFCKEMKTTTILRLLIAAEIVFGLLEVAADLTTVTFLPVEFQQYIENEVEVDLSIMGGLGLGAAMLLLVGVFVSWIGLWRLWRPARTIYTVCWIASVPIYLILDPVAWNTPLGAMFSELSILAAGAIISLLYFSDVAEHFNKKKAEQVGDGDAEEAV